MKGVLSGIFYFLTLFLFAQSPLYDFVSFKKTIKIPASLNSERSAVIFSVPNKSGDFVTVGDYEKMISQVHKAFITMGIDAIFYLQDINIVASNAALDSSVDLFTKREIKNIIFITKSNNEFELIMAPYSGTAKMIVSNSDVFYLKANDLYSLLLNVGKEVKRADQQVQNFLIPEKPNYLQGISIVEKTLLKNYPGILRRSKLAVERFSSIDTTTILSKEVMERTRKYNERVRAKNQELESIMKSYPYEYELINAMSDDDLRRNRYQFLLRYVCATTRNVRQMLDYEVTPSQSGFVSIIPVMPDQTRVKTIPQDAIVCKYFIRQNISKNVHVGEWDADVTWQDALRNIIGNLTQELNVKN
ncbi:hypothetical protein [Ekhidna sp.]|uniref:hypothetical protein n=2 Tax=Ekhidna sp. TaxID=2608089 RepID=UPI0032981597